MDRVLSNPNAAERAMAKRLLGWVVCAKRPLKWHEIQCAVSIDLKEESVDFDARRLRVNARELCGSLLEIRPGDRLDLVHRTARMRVMYHGWRRIWLMIYSYLAQESHVQVTEVEKEIALLCMRYLVFEFFDDDLEYDELREYILNGSYAFQEYAALHWVDHLESISSDDRLHLENLASTIDEYTAKYGECDREQDVLPKSSMLNSESSASRSLLETIRLVKETRITRINEEGLSTLGALGDIMSNVRTAMEQLAGTLSSADMAKELETYYGRNWFKCPKHACFYFHEGFLSAKLRDGHVERHERPFCCTETGCSRVQIGFSSEKELKKHMLITHPDPGALSWKFFKVKEPKPRQSFQCTLCPKLFTRSTSLRNHLRTHTDERPFICTVCGKAFARSMDRKRHEKIHTGERPFVCRGELGLGRSWGCGRSFARPDTLGQHFYSNDGRICIQPLRDEERQRVNCHQIQTSNVTPQNLPDATPGDLSLLPEVLQQQYPALRMTDWQQPDQGLNTGLFDAASGQETAQGAREVSMDWTETPVSRNDGTDA